GGEAHVRARGIVAPVSRQHRAIVEFVGPSILEQIRDDAEDAADLVGENVDERRAVAHDRGLRHALTASTHTLDRPGKCAAAPFASGSHGSGVTCVTAYAKPQRSSSRRTSGA